MPPPEIKESRDGTYRAILLVMMLSVIAGAVIALLGDYYFHNEAIKNVGVGAVIVSGAIYFFFRFLGRQADKKNVSDERDDDL